MWSKAQVYVASGVYDEVKSLKIVVIHLRTTILTIKGGYYNPNASILRMVFY